MPAWLENNVYIKLKRQHTFSAEALAYAFSVEGLGMVVKEVILENFMSYEYARIPLKPGLNIVCGPNGSGKSSILLALSVALGQTYTERSRKLSDLIRWGKDVARVTLVFDNTPRKGRRPFPKYRMDDFQLSRYLRKDGTYWYEANFHVIDKSDVVRLLSGLGINPDNMLIIMHQNMVEEFALTTPQRKLEMVEEAVGFSEFRRNVIESRERLSKILSEEESVSNLFEGAEQTLEYWTGEHEKYQRRKELISRKEFLERELFWSQMVRQEKLMEAWTRKIEGKRGELGTVVKGIDEAGNAVKSIGKSLEGLDYDHKKTFFSILQLEKERTEVEVKAQLLGETLDKVASFRKGLKDGDGFDEYLKETRSQLGTSRNAVKAFVGKVEAAQRSLIDVEDAIRSTTEDYINKRVEEAVLRYRRGFLEEEMGELARELSKAEGELKSLRAVRLRYGPRIETARGPVEVSEEIKVVNAYINALGKVSEDAEKMFLNYSKIYEDLKRRAQTLSENRARVLEEVEARVKVWRDFVKTLLDDINPVYQEILSKIDAVGRVRLVSVEDVEMAGLELLVGFRGAKPVILDAYTQSGGERSTALMGFLLALQQHIRSPIRAVDEFDIHMDPRNRELITQTLLGSVVDRDYQYITITPGQLTGALMSAHVITVQNVAGGSEVRTAK